MFGICLAGTVLSAAATDVDLDRVNAKLRQAGAPWCGKLAELDADGRRRCVIKSENWGTAGAANAYAFFGGTSITGELLAALSEAELAMVLGHEFAHLVLSHQLHFMRMAAASKPGGTDAMLLPVVEQYQLEPHEDTPADPKAAELDADKLGLFFAGLAGYPVQQMALLWRDKANRLPGWENGQSNATHPSLAQRSRASRAAASEFCRLLRRGQALVPAEPRLQPRYELSLDELKALQKTVDAAQVCGSLR